MSSEPKVSHHIRVIREWRYDCKQIETYARGIEEIARDYLSDGYLEHPQASLSHAIESAEKMLRALRKLEKNAQ